MNIDPNWVSAIATAFSALVALGALTLSFIIYRAKKQADARAAKLETENAKLRNSWIPLHRALQYVALHSAWSRTANDPDGLSLEQRLSEEVLEALSRGEVQARGRKVFGYWEKMGSASQPIDQKFWQSAFIQSFGEIVMHDDRRCIAATDGGLPVASRSQYREICLLRSDVLTRWSKAKDGKAVNSAYYGPLIEYWRNGGVHGEEARRLDAESRLFEALGSAIGDR
jgi:hypothetical protein